MALVYQFFGSLMAILALAWLAARLRLGGDPRLANQDEARELARQMVFGFEPVDVAVDRYGLGALCRDPGGRIMVLKRHGSHWAARIVDGPSDSRLDHGHLVVMTPDRRFGVVALDLGETAPLWAARLRQMAA